MRFAVALLSILAIASIIGTVLNQNEPLPNYAVKFGPFWFEIFQFLGLYDVYSASWFVLIMVFLVISTGLCLIRNTPVFLRDMKNFRSKATATSLAGMKHNALLSTKLKPEIAQQYLNVQGFHCTTTTKADGNILLAAKKGSSSKLGYILAHGAIIMICLGGLIDSNLAIKVGTLIGHIIPDDTATTANSFSEKSHLSSSNLSFRGDVTLPEGSAADVIFLNTGKGFLVQELPFVIQLNKFSVDYYTSGMPKNFISNVTVTSKKSGIKKEATLRVNHPLTVDGVTIYQASFGDGGSDLNFKAWNIEQPQIQPVKLNAVSMRSFPLNLGKQKYQLEFGDFKLFNVENQSAPKNTPDSFSQTLTDVRDVTKQKDFVNIGPSITFKIRDETGQANEYLHYMLPVKQDGVPFFLAGMRNQVSEPFRFVRLPADQEESLDTFMRFRRAFSNPRLREQAAKNAAEHIDPTMRDNFKQSVETILTLFAQNGYPTIDQFIRTNIPADKQTEMGQLFIQILHGASANLFDLALADAKKAPWKNSSKRDQFLLNSLIGSSALHEYGAPIFLELESFKQVQASGLQMTRSPGQFLVYLGALFLVIGIFFMFYIRERRAWLLFDGDTIRFAMSATRHMRDLEKEFPMHQQRLNQLAKDIPL